MSALLDELIAGVGREHVLCDEASLEPYLTDWRGRYHGRAEAVVRPATTAEVSRVVKACAQAGVAVVPQGGNTGLCGGATPLASGRSVVLSLGRMNRIRHVNVADGAITVEAGCTLAAVQAAADAHECLFPLSLASEGSCQIGGNLSTNAGGVHVLRYGNTRDQVLGLEVVLPDGRVWDGLRALRKDNTGYDLKQLFIGAEGTLGVITAVVLKLYPRPRSRAVAWLSVGDPAAAVALLAHVRERCAERVNAFELVGKSALDLVLRHLPGSVDPLPGGGDWGVLLELSDAGDDTALAGMAEEAIGGALARGLACDAVLAASTSQMSALWALRENISEAQKREGISIKHDISVPVSRIPDFLARAEAVLREEWPDLRIVVFGHIGDGNLHYNLSRPEAGDNAAFIAQSSLATRRVHDLVVGVGGSISAEHGIGQLKRAENAHYKSPVELELMRSIKAALDPLGVMNPGKLL